MSDHPVTGRLDAETLAAYIDGVLSAEERARVEAALAADPESYEWVVNALGTGVRTGVGTEVGTGVRTEVRTEVRSGADTGATTEVRTEAATGVATRVRRTGDTPERRDFSPGDDLDWFVPLPGRLSARRRSARARVAAVLALAAALVLAAQIDSSWWRRPPGAGDVEPRVATLVAAIGEERYIEGRFTGGFKYGPLRPVTRAPADLSSQNLALLAAAGELQKRAQSAPTPAQLHAWGVAQVLLGDAEGGIGSLRAVLEQRPDDPAVLSDLAAALLERARRDQRPADTAEALDLTARSLALAADGPEALFNRAVALEAMGLSDEALAAWTDCVSRLAGPWKAEAERRLERLRMRSRAVERVSPGPPMTTEAAIRRLHELLTLPDSQQPAAALTLAGESDTLQTPAHAQLTRMAACVAASDSEARRTLRQAIALLASARDLARADQFQAAATVGASAARMAVDRCFPLAYEAEKHVFQNQFLLGQFDALQARLRALAVDPRSRDDVVILADIQTRLASTRYLQGDFYEALTLHLAALDAATAQGNADTIAGIEVAVAEAYRALADWEQSWQHYRAAFARLPRLSDQTRVHVLYASAATGALHQGLPATAAHLAREAIAHADRVDVAGFRAESHYLLARALARTGEHAEAERSLRQAEQQLARVTDGGIHDRLAAEFHYSAAIVASERAPGVALEHARESARLFARTSNTHRVAPLALLEARAERGLGRHDEAEATLVAATAVIGQQAAEVADHGLQVMFIDQGWELFSELAELKLVDGRHEAALSTLESGMRLASGQGGTLGGGPPTPSALDSGRGMLVYLFLADRGVAWLLTKDGVVHRDIPASRAELDRDIRGLQALLDQRAAPEPIAAAAARVATHLVTPVEPWLDGIDELFIVSDPLLHRVPFALLPAADGRPLVTRAALAFCASLSRCAASSGQAGALPPRGGPVAALFSSSRGPSALPNAEAEAVAVVGHYAAGRAERATAESVERALQTSRVVHYAGHAVVNPDRPWLGTLLLGGEDGEDGESHVALGALARTPRAEVVVLAACDTYRGRAYRGQGTVGMAALLLSRGVRSVVASMSRVHDAASLSLMDALHRGLAQGLSPWHALAAAQRDLLSSAHPGDWAQALVLADGTWADERPTTATR
jgi:CHAT domain-containing protein